MDPYLTDSSRWTAIEAHDPKADGSFVYCVKTTGIYCRPTCGARLARRANTVFHDNASAAQNAGFRACKRCKPDLAEHDPQWSIIAQARQTIERSQIEKGTIPSLSDLAEEAGLTKSHFHRVFKRITGVTPRTYAEGLRKESVTELKSPRSPSTGTPSLAYMAGETASESPAAPVLHQLAPGSDGSPAHRPRSNEGAPSLGPQLDSAASSGSELMHDLYRAASGISPRKVAGSNPMPTEICYTIQPWLPSFVLIATSPSGLCSIDIEESSEKLLGALEARFPASKISLSTWMPGALSPPMETQNPQHMIFASIMEALLNPTGKILDIPFDLH